MDIPTRRIERLIGWLTFSIGVTSIQRNNSIAYQVMGAIAPIPWWVLVYCGLGLLMVAATYTSNLRARLVIAGLLLLLWTGTLTLVALSGPLGPIGGYGTVISCYLFFLIVGYLKDG